MGEEEKLLERGKLFTKAMAVCCKQKYATGVYTSGVVFEPRFYEGLADMLKKDELPIFNWVWFGLYRSEGGAKRLHLRHGCVWQGGNGGVEHRRRAGGTARLWQALPPMCWRVM